MLNNFKKQLQNKGELYLKIKVHPGVAKTAIIKIMDDETIKIDITAPPIKGKANQELIRFLAKEFDVLKNNVKIISGTNTKVKLVKIVK